MIALFTTMIVQSVLIYNTKHNFSANSIQATGTSFIGVPEV